MPRPITIAIVYSIAIHLVLFLVADGLLRASSQPSIFNTPLVVSIEPSRSTGDVVDERLVVPAAATDDAIPVKTSRAKSVADDPDEIARAVAVPAASEVTPMDLEPATATTGAEVRDDGGKRVALDVVTTTSTARRVATVGPAEAAASVSPQATLSSRQEKMLNRKLREWTGSLHEMPEKTSGLTWKHRGQEYSARFTQLPAADDMGIERVIVEISTEQEGKRLSSEVHLKRLAFSNYAQFVNRWDPNVEMFNDEMYGRFHSNTEFNVTYDRKVRPVFHGKVTTSSRRINVTSRRGGTKRDQIFTGGLQTGVRRIGLPGRFLPFPDEGKRADDQVHRFAGDTRITFHPDGTFVWQAIDTGLPAQTGALSRATTFLLADKNAELHIKGTVKGKVLVYSPERIVIEDDLVYARNPEESPDADDYLGLVSGKNVDIAPPDITGPGDLFINAAIHAKRRFAVRRFRSGGEALLYLYGSLSAGSISATEPRYYTRIQFDSRLENLRPPRFPMTDQYEVESWDAVWNVEPIE